MIIIKSLIIRAMNGDKEAFDELALSIKNYLYSEAGTKLINKQDIEDAVQSTLYMAYKNIGTLHSPYCFKNWITTILYNQCYEICRNDIKQKKVIQKMAKYASAYESEFDIDEFDTLIKDLSDKEKSILELLCRKDLNYKEIAEELNININTVKYYACTRRSKIKSIIYKNPIIIFILCFFIAGVVVSAVTLISHLKKSVSTADVGVNNDGVPMAVENLDWYQQVDMEYQDLGGGYKIKMDYLLMDEMCLYMIFNLESEEDLSKYSDVSLPDLRIVNENGDVICDKKNLATNQSAQKFGCKLTENNAHSIQFLVYMYSESFPICKTLNFSLSTILLTEQKAFSNKEYRIYKSIEFEVDLIEKFINRQYTSYISNNATVKRSIISNTGFYAILEFNPINNNYYYLIDENNNYYDCYAYTLTNVNTLKCIVISKFNNSNINKINLSIFNESLELIQYK